MWAGSLTPPFINNVTLNKLLSFSEAVASRVKWGLIVFIALACFED